MFELSAYGTYTEIKLGSISLTERRAQTQHLPVVQHSPQRINFSPKSPKTNGITVRFEHLVPSRAAASGIHLLDATARGILTSPTCGESDSPPNMGAPLAIVLPGH